MYNLDIYRRQARNLAWYDDEGEVTHNPFKKFRRRPQRSQSIQLEEHPEQTRGLDAEDVAQAEAATRAYDAANPPAPGTPGSDPSYKAQNPDSIASGKPLNASTARDGEASKPRLRNKFGLGKSRDEEQGGEEDVEKFGSSEPRFTLASQLRATIFNSWINILFLAAPAGSMFSSRCWFLWRDLLICSSCVVCGQG